jgi:hypothetical protein
MPDEPFAEVVARLDSLAAKLRAGSGPNYPVLARIAAEMAALKERGAGTEPPLAAAVAASLSRVIARPLHDHPKFVDLIEIHIAALRLAASDGPDAGGPDGGDKLIADLDAATRKVFEKKAPKRR